MSESKITCPECGSTEVTVAAVQTFMVNTGEHYCHSVKTHDSDTKSRCLDCDWEGIRSQLIGDEDE